MSVAGRVRNTKTGLTKMFSNAKTTDTIIADINPSTTTPGKKLDSI